MWNTRLTMSGLSEGCWPGMTDKVSSISGHKALHVKVTNKSGHPNLWHNAT